MLDQAQFSEIPKSEQAAHQSRIVPVHDDAHGYNAGPKDSFGVLLDTSQKPCVVFVLSGQVGIFSELKAFFDMVVIGLANMHAVLNMLDAVFGTVRDQGHCGKVE